jgi:ABC-type glycerol-3-phosphate transport system substrate-binding protein
MEKEHNLPYNKVIEFLKNEISTGELQKNARIPSENKLAKACSVGVYDARKAVNILKEQGVLYSLPKSGVYVSEKSITSNNNLNCRMPNSSRSDGFHIFEHARLVKPKLNFLISGWDSYTKLVWEEIFKIVNLQNKNFSATPVFPNNAQEYLHTAGTCDLFMTTPGNYYNGNGNFPESLKYPEGFFDNKNIIEKYKTAVFTDGKITSCPFACSMICGGINTEVLSRNEIKKIISVESWKEAMEIFPSLENNHPNHFGSNIDWVFTPNVRHILYMQNGVFADFAKKKIKFNAKHIEVLEAIEKYSNTKKELLNYSLEMDNKKFCTWTEYTCVWMRKNRMKNFIPWQLPLGEDGGYPEGLDSIFINANTKHKQEALAMTESMISIEVQNLVENIRGEHSVRDDVVNRFGGYPSDWRKTIKNMTENGIVDSEFFTGYQPFINSTFSPLSQKLFNKEITAESFIEYAIKAAKESGL